MTSLEEKLRSMRSSMQEMQLRGSQQKQTISELQAKNSQQTAEMDSLRRRMDELQQVRTHQLLVVGLIDPVCLVVCSVFKPMVAHLN